jgi:hypothetical protein
VPDRALSQALLGRLGQLTNDKTGDSVLL